MIAANVGSLESAARRYALDGQEEWRKLLRHFDLADGFALAVVLVTDADGASLCRRELECHLEQSGHVIQDVPLSNPDDLQRLPEHFLDTTLADNVACLWISAVSPDYASDHPHWRAAWEHALGKLNAFRNPIRDHFRCTVVFVGAPWLQETMREIAPDLWSVRTLVARIEPALNATIDLDIVDDTLTIWEPDVEFALEEADKLRGRPGRELGLARLLDRAGAGFAADGKWIEADNALQEALEIEESHRAPQDVLLQTLISLSVVSLQLKRTRQTLEFANRALAIAREINDSTREAVLLSVMGDVRSDLGELRSAIELWQQALGIANRSGDQKTTIVVLRNLGYAHLEERQFKRAIKYFEKAVAAARGVGDRSGEANNLYSIGITRLSMSDPYRAASFFQRAIDIALETKNHKIAVNAIRGMSLAMTTAGQTSAAIDFAFLAKDLGGQLHIPAAETLRKRLAAANKKVVGPMIR